VDFDELQPGDLAMDGLDQRALAHAARAPQKGIVGGKAAGEAKRVGKERIAHAVDTPKQGQGHSIDIAYGLKALGLGLPDKGIRGVEIGPVGFTRSKTLKRPGDPLQKAGKGFLKVHAAPVAKPIWAAIVAPTFKLARRKAARRATPVEGGNP